MSNKGTVMAIDAMGGDWGPSVIVPGALRAARETGVGLKFVGRDSELRLVLEQHPCQDLDVEIVHADEVADAGEKSSHRLRKRRGTSIQVASHLIKDGRAQGLVSAGHTGPTLATTMLVLGRIKGIDRPGLATILPRENKPLLLVDVGANVDSKPRHLVQFAIMADTLARNVLKENNPKVGILNIGEEQGKGNAQVTEAYAMLKSTSLNFVGNMEGRDVFQSDIDIAVCDGFVGNIALKLSEGLGRAFSNMLKQELSRSRLSKLGALMARPALHRIGKRLDYEEYGGAPLLGLNGTVFVCHGSAGETAISQAVKMAVEFTTTKANDTIRQTLEMHPELTRFHRIRHFMSSGQKSGSHSEEGASEEQQG
jgi:glycerol-3-phosphate acyltransferase PlsX